ncbi:hypothetical protein C2845_PM11G02140 [Panicum miliaceum]|uniref:Protein kinase domain-containing protein n=1 Tax=Panicum miliaceum TaxID=4540 RepID=A0A3L6RUY0_PANMI|nr:hypothetical protein C2845_PM11G02140 [Panicum miliaceum]
MAFRNISGLGVGGWLGPELLKFQSLKKLNLAANKFEGNMPSTLPWLHSLKYLNFSYNKLSGIIGDVFVNMDSLETMDLSFNGFSGDLPRSFSLLTNLRYLYLHHNEFTGSVILLAGLPLSSLNIENNHFSGYVPGTFESIPELRIDGNQFQPGFRHASSSFTRRAHSPPPQALSPSPPPPPPSSLPPAAKQNPKHRPKSPKPSFGYSSLQSNSHHRKSHSRVTAAAVASATCTVFVLLIVGFVLKSWKRCSTSPKSTSNRAKTFPANMEAVPKANEVLYSWSSLLIGSDPSSSNGITSDRVPKIKSWSKTSKNLLTAKQFPAADILAATRDFNEECLIGEGFTGRVYRGDFSDGQLLAIKRIDMVDLSLSEQDELMDMLWNISRLNHPNICALVGYCVEFGHCALLFEYAENGSLDDILFSAATRSRALSWKARMKIALGVAYALDASTDKLMPYLCDSGLTKLSHFVSTAGTKDSEAITSAKGYAAPELTDPGADGIKADIYSFGVILLVLLTGEKAFDSSRKQNEQFLVDWAAPHLDDLDSLERITDPRISGSMPPKAISSLGIIILLCIKLCDTTLKQWKTVPVSQGGTESCISR